MQGSLTERNSSFIDGQSIVAARSYSMKPPNAMRLFPVRPQTASLSNRAGILHNTATPNEGTLENSNARSDLPNSVDSPKLGSKHCIPIR